MNLKIWKNEMCELKWRLIYEMLNVPIKMLNVAIKMLNEAKDMKNIGKYICVAKYW